MDTTYYRFRFLIYFAAFMLVLSVCFVYAEPAPSHAHLLFQTAPQHSGFLASSSVEPTFDPADLRAATLPVVTPAMLQQLEDASHAKHGLFHRPRRVAVRNDSTGSSNQSSILNLIAEPAAAQAR